jgi:shikimate dehydrogenase
MRGFGLSFLVERGPNMTIKIGLIGHAISQSQSPALHKMLGEIYGFDIQYDLIEPEHNTLECFNETVGRMRSEGYVATNVTFPFKQLATHFVTNSDQAVEMVGSTNTMRIGAEAIDATNTDFSGFVKGYQIRRGDKSAGDVLMLGAGGVGRAVAFGLTKLNAKKIYVYDLSAAGAESLVEALVAAGADAEAILADEIPKIAKEVDGLVNCTPIGHLKSPGNPLDAALFGCQSWAFDAVYVPLDTEFLKASHTAGLDLVSGFDLFFYQGIDAFQFFVQKEVDPALAREQFVAKFNVSSQLLKL